MRSTKTLLRLCALLLCAAMCTLALFSCGGNDKDNAKFGIVSMVENGAFTDMKAGIIQGLADAGYVDGENCTIDYQCAGGDAGTLATIVNSMNDGTYTAVFCIATPTTQAFVNLSSNTPCFFCAVSAPLAAGVVSDLSKPDKNTTGTSNAIPVEDILSLALAVDAGLSKVGLISSGTEANATNTIAEFKAALDAKNIAYYEVFAQNSAEVSTAAAALVDAGCDAVFVPNDSIVQAGVTALADICNEAGVPTYCSSATTVDSGCFAAIAIDDVDIGKLTASMCVEYLNGKALTDISVIVCDINYCAVYVSASAQSKLGITLPAGYEAVTRK